MAFKFVVLAALVACASAGQIAYSAGPAAHAAPIAYKSYAAAPIAYKSYAAAPVAYKTVAAAPVAYAAPVAKAVVTKTVDAEYDPNPQYSYSYDVNDALTGDSKTQEEQRDGDVVRGSYSLVEADGTRRVVEYTADPHNGFNAVVHKEPAQVAVKAVHAAPVVKAVHAAPIVKAFHAAPAVATYAAPALAYKSHGAYY
ncbi:cuticular protein RR-2 family member 13 isoform X1 [Nasonia vitripennis]|uniref:Uncharacterized protein n=1 Tax=Nasonia vitripennis TaxID=7425 RepID=A0A7M7QX72_NASVI|nr:cuticular protein RR-2 family member 13 isoform X1 [Nasonia vitripennis]